MPDHYVSSLFESDLIRIENFDCQGPKHSGEEMASNHEMVFVRKGAFERNNAFGRMVADSNHILFFHQNQSYQITHPLAGGDTSTVISIAPSALLDIIEVIDPSVQERPQAPFTSGHGLAGSRQQLRLHRVLRAASLGVEPLQIEEQVLTLAASVIRQAHHAAGRRHGCTRPPTASCRGAIANQAKIVLAERFREKLSLKQLASETFTSPYHLCRVFKRDTGLPIHHYLLRLRLTRSLDDIAENPGINLAQVAFGLGFSSHSHFTAAFQKAFGTPPSRFARESSARTVKELKARMGPQ
jgi:AraC-like DNA-binding protein